MVSNGRLVLFFKKVQNSDFADTVCRKRNLKAKPIKFIPKREIAVF